MRRGLVTGSVDVRYGRKGRRLGSAADKALGMSGVGDVEGSLARDRAFLDAPEVNVRGREECDTAVAMLVVVEFEEGGAKLASFSKIGKYLPDTAACISRS